MSHCSWQKTNEVKGGDGSWNTPRGGLPNHQLWGFSFIVGHDQRDGHYNGADGYPNHMARWLNRKLQTDFGFTWTKFQYAGANSQTHGQMELVIVIVQVLGRMEYFFLVLYQSVLESKLGW